MDVTWLFSYCPKWMNGFSVQFAVLEQLDHVLVLFRNLPNDSSIMVVVTSLQIKEDILHVDEEII